jgi:uroporphyrin-III C-methyltransferase/precorrin-2 dehydrogenase/sirohydrochlorin ferrochelatase
MSTPLPFQLQISGRPVLLIGSGEAADAKARLLTERGAVITHWPNRPCAEQIRHATEANRTAASRFVLVIIAEVCDWTRALMPWLEQERLLLNAVDAPELSDGFIPAIVSRGRVQIGIGTGGSSPVLARFIRTRLEQVLPQGLEELAELADRWQLRVRQVIKDLGIRRRFWERQLSGSAGQAALDQRPELADNIIQQALDSEQPAPGRVALVGAGPGDASLLTLKGLQRLQEADVVLFDKLVSPEVLSLARRDAQLEDVGKRRGHCPTPQESINRRLVELGQQGLSVCRLKGGDPYLFGRGGEEALALVEAGIPVEVVPGVTTASATAAATGIPLTHRRLARSVRFITGHLALEQTETDWQPLALGQETLVIYMGFSHLETIAARLMAAGLSPTTPLVLVQNATTPRQRVVHGEIGRSLQATEQLRLAEGPVLILVGETTRLAKQLDPSLAAQLATATADPLFWLDSA